MTSNSSDIWERAIELAEKFNVSRQEALDRIREQDRLDREERLQERKIEMEFKLKEKEMEVERQNKLREEENRIKREEKREEIEREDRLKKEALERDDRLRRDEYERQLQMEKLRLEDEKMRTGNELRRTELENRSDTYNGRYVGIRGDIGVKRYDLGVGKWNLNTDLQGFLNRFETTATAYELPIRLYAIELAKCLEGPALLVYETLSPESRLNYDELKRALMKRFKYTESGLRKRFQNARTLAGESQKDFVARLYKLFNTWRELGEYEDSAEGIAEMIIKDVYFRSQPFQVQTHLKELGKTSLAEMARKAENYREAHNISGVKDEYVGRRDFKTTIDRSNDYNGLDTQNKVNDTDARDQKRFSEKLYQRDMRSGTRNGKACYICGSLNHLARQCTERGRSKWRDGDARDVYRQHVAACQTADECELEDDDDDEMRGSYRERIVNVPSCGRLPVVAAVTEFFENEIGEDILKDVKRNYIGIGTINEQRVKFMRDTGASISIARTGLVNEGQMTGKFVTCVLVDRCVRKYPEAVVRVDTPYYCGRLKVACIDTALYDLILGNDVMRLENRAKVMTGSEKSCEDRMSDDDDCKQRLTDTIIFQRSHEINSSRDKDGIKPEDDVKEARGLDRGVKLKDQYEELKVEEKNISCPDNKYANGENDEEIVAVQTRMQKMIETRALKPLKLTKSEALNVTAEQFRKMQNEDPALKKYWRLAETQNRTGKSWYCIEQDILYRRYRNEKVDEDVKQLMVPEELVDRVIAFGHESLLSAHQGTQSTMRKIMTEFYFPRLNDRIRKYVKSCDLCQRASNKKVGGRAPIQSMKIAASAFEEVHIDIVGEISPPSAENHRWLLTMIDSATRFPIAIPMKKIDSVSIAEALLTQFSIFGHPKVILSDNAANLTSEVMKQIYHLYGIRLKNSPVYHPNANSVIERSHATMKGILRKLVNEQPRQWHRYIAPLLFAMRTTQNYSGYSSFELMFGRSCRSHLSLLRELWVGQEQQAEEKSVYQYVLDLQDRIESTCKLAQEEMSRIQGKNKEYFNKKARLRELNEGDKVLVLIPGCANKLEFQWTGPEIIVKRLGIANYRVKNEAGKERTFHVNMLKKYESRENEGEERNKSTFDDQHDDKEDGEDMDIGAVIGVVEDSDDEQEVTEGEMERASAGETEKLQLYNVQPRETWRDVQINPELSEGDQRKIRSVVEEYADIFSDVPTTTHLLSHEIKLTTEEPVRSKPYKIPLALADAVQKEIQSLEQHGWIERSNAPYASPIVIVKKKGTTDIRLCVNYKKLNDITVEDPMPLVEMEDVLSKISDARILSVLDLSKGYYAIPLDEKSKDYTTFVTPTDTYRFTVNPFGLRNAGAVFCRLMRLILRGATNVGNYVDDVIAHNKNVDCHVVTLQNLFQRLRDANVKAKPSKARLGFFKVDFLGHTIGSGEIKPTETNICKILNATAPTTKKGVRALCGAMNFVRKFIPNCAELIKPITELTKKNSSEIVKWGEEQEQAFEQIKKILTSDPVLKLYDISKEHVLQTDASETAVAGTLLQREADGTLHPAFYVSKKLLPREIRYTVTEREALAVVWSLTKLYRYLYGRHFEILSDHEALVLLNSPKLSSSPRVARWQLFLQSFDFTLRFVEGTQNGLADYLSRMNDA